MVTSVFDETDATMISATSCIFFDVTREKKGPAALGDAKKRSFYIETAYYTNKHRL